MSAHRTSDGGEGSAREWIIGMILHRGVEYEERGPLREQADYLKRRLANTVRALRKCGISVAVTIPEVETA